MLIVSIDPGIVNIGFAVFDSLTKEIVFADKIRLVTQMKMLKKESELIPRIYQLFFTGKIGSYLNSCDLVLIEQQMLKKFILVQYILGTLCFEKNINYQFFSPRIVKTYFASGKTARKDRGKSVRGVRNNYKANKKTAIEIASHLFPAFMKRVCKDKQDDVADAILQAACAADILEKNISTIKKTT